MTQAEIDERVERLASPRRGWFRVARASCWGNDNDPPVEGARLCECRDDEGWLKTWFVEIPDVMEFVRQHGCCIVALDYGGHGAITIYDADVE